MMKVKHIFGLILLKISLSITVYSVCKFILFISSPQKTDGVAEVSFEELWADKPLLKSTCRNLLWNCIWIILFILQHSFTKVDAVKKFWAKCSMAVYDRAIYNLVSSYALLLILQNWRTLNVVYFWKIDAPTFSLVWWAFVVAQFLAWNTICFGALLMDLPEILGIKQIYYEIKELGEPSVYKAKELNRLLNNVRHPSFLGFAVILWCTNFLSFDRFLLATLFTLYMYLAWNPDKQDVSYQRSQLERKKVELKYDLKAN